MSLVFEPVALTGADGSALFLRRAGHGPAVLLLHGFPQTHLMWRDIAPRLAGAFTVICADLPGYGESDPTPAGQDVQSKRAMAQVLVEAMATMGFERFAVVGHDRGGRVAYRMALDHPGRVTAVAALDIIPTEAAWARADDRFALAYWPFSFLAQPAPLPERLLSGCPEAVVDAALSQWGTPAEVRLAYLDALRDPGRAQAICQEYRAAASTDRDHDRQDLSAGRRIACPLLALWSADGPLGAWFAAEGGPLAIWRAYADRVEGEGVRGGHFFPEAYPTETAARLRAFLQR